LAIPKSITFGTGNPSCSVTRMFDGLISRALKGVGSL
jgi:hypothetical protein